MTYSSCQPSHSSPKCRGRGGGGTGGEQHALVLPVTFEDEAWHGAAGQAELAIVIEHAQCSSTTNCMVFALAALMARAGMLPGAYSWSDIFGPS